MSDIFIGALNISITASYLILAVLLLRLLLKKAPKWITCLLWGIVALRLIMPFTIESDISLVPSSQTITHTQSENIQYEINTGIDTFDNTINQIIIRNPNSNTPPVSNNQETNNNVSSVPATPQQSNEKASLFDILFIVWVAGIAAMFIFSTVSYIRIYKNVRASIIYRDNIYYCDTIDSPFILGIIQPKIYIPSGIAQNSLNYVISHENAHLKRRDHLWKPFGFLLLSIYWFNPFLWLSYIMLCRDIESACDEKVIKDMSNEDKKGYSTALLNCSVHRRMITACPVAFGEVGVKERIKSVLNYKKPAFWIIAVAIVTSIAVAVCFLTNPKEKVELSFLPLEFSLSGNGAWNYTFTVNPDGTFSGKYTDWNAESGEGYAGSYIICEFSGKFKDIKANDDYSCSLTVAKFESKYKDKEEWIEDGTKYIATNSLEDFAVGRKFLLYKPNISLDKLDKEVLIDWPYRYDENDGTLSCYTLYSPSYKGSYTRSFFSKRIFNVDESQVLNTYNELMNSFYNQNPDFYYTVKDIDGNGVKELIIQVNTSITVYTYEYGIKQLDSYDFVTGTARLFASESPKYPGIFYYTVGGGCDHYSYMTLNNGYLNQTKLCEYYYSADKPYWKNISDDKEIIAEAKALYNGNRDIEFIKFEPTSSDENSVTFTNIFFTYSASVLFDEQNNAKSLVVVNKDTGETVQQTEISKFENFTDKPIYAIDITFDGYVDLLIPYERSANAVYFSAYIYDSSLSDPNAYNFVYAPSFEEIPNFSLDKQNKKILSKRTQSQITSYGVDWYSLSNSDFMPSHSLYFEPANLKDQTHSENQIYFKESRYDFDQKETVVNEFVAASDGVIDPDKTDPKVASYYEDNSFWDLDSDKWDGLFKNENGVLCIDDDSILKLNLSLQEVKTIFEPLLNKAIEVEQAIINDAATFEYEDKIAFRQNDSDYSLITDKDFQSLDDVWNYAYTAFTPEAAQRAFKHMLDQGLVPRFLEKDGKLYYNRNAHSYKSKFDMESIEIVDQLEDSIIVGIKNYGYDKNNPDTCFFIMTNTKNGWRLATTETESYNDIDVTDYYKDPSTNNVVNAYVNFLSGATYAMDKSPNKAATSKDNFLITDLYNRDLQPGIDSYTYFDLNDDNIPELITDGYCMSVFAYKNNQVTMIYESPAGSSSLKYLLANKKIYWSLSTIGVSYEIASFDKDLNVTVDTYFDGKTEQVGDEEIFYHNENKITESEFHKLKAEFFASHFFAPPDTPWYAYTTNANEESRNIGETQPETTEIITINGKSYQSYVASNVDVRYIWVSKLEYEMSTEWGWVPVGTRNFYSLDLLGKVNEGRK